MGRWRIQQCKESGYVQCFDMETGKFIRHGFEEKEPFWNLTGPELLDISITNYCERACDFCYRSSNQHGKFLAIIDYKSILQQAKALGTLQIALGGGNPNQHPEFVKILELTRKYGIIPSYTTNGQGMTEEIYIASKKYCGAIAVSWYSPYDDALEVIKKCEQYKIKVNIHFMLSRETVNDAIRFLDEQKDILSTINAIVFLNYKPIHSSAELSLKNSEKISEFFDRVLDVRECKVGFDSCMISFLTTIRDGFFEETVEYCEAARFSAFISEELKMYPCSFYNDTGRGGIDLKTVSLQDGWKQGIEFVNMRERLSKSGNQEYLIEQCKWCEKYEMCHGGCQVFNINMC